MVVDVTTPAVIVPDVLSKSNGPVAVSAPPTITPPSNLDIPSNLDSLPTYSEVCAVPAE